MTFTEALLPPSRSMPVNGLLLSAGSHNSARSLDTPLTSQGADTEPSEAQYTGKLAQYALTRTASGRGIGLSAVGLPSAASEGDVAGLHTASSAQSGTLVIDGVVVDRGNQGW